jgi:hypothetical protein
MLAVVQRATWFSTGMMRVDEKRFGPQPNPESCHSGFFVFISGGARRQQMDVDVGHFKGAEGGSNDYAVSLYNLGTIYDFKNGHQVWINYGEGFDLLDPAKFYGKPGLSETTKPAPACRASTRLPSKTTLTTRSAAIPPSTC